MIPICFESSMLTVTEFSGFQPSGTTTLVADPHEIGNACRAVGMKAMADEIDSVPNKVYLVVPALTVTVQAEQLGRYYIRGYGGY